MNYKQTFVLLLLIFFFSLSIKANHILGGHFSYTCLGGNQYGLTLTYYSDCFGLDNNTWPPAQELINLSTNDGCIDYSYLLNFVSETEISDLCPSELTFSSCNDGIIPGTVEVVYYTEITLDPLCVWDIVWSAGDYNYFANVDNSSLNTVHFEVSIDPSIPCEETLNVTSMNIPYYCSGDVVSHQPTFNNPQGYDLSYSFTDVFSNGPVPIPGYFNIPGIGIDPATGEITFTAPATAVNQSYVIAIEVTMSSGGLAVGTYIEYMSFIIRNCDSPPTVFSTPAVFDHHPDVNAVSETNIEGCVGDSLCFYISAENSNVFSAVNLTADIAGTPFSSAQFIVDGVNPAIGQFCILLTPAMEGTTVLTFDAINSACVNPTFSSFDITIAVSPQMSSSVLDSTVCFNSNFEINIDGSSDVNWNFISGTDPGFIPGSTTQNFVATENLQIEINSNDPNALMFCNSQDTININVALSGINAVIENETCVQNDGSIDLTMDVGSGNYSYNWTPGDINTQDISNQAGGSYNVEIEDLDLNCTANIVYLIDSITPPSGSITNDTTICTGDCYDIVFNLEGVGPFEVELMNLTTNLLEPVPQVNDGDTYQVCPTTNTSYELQLISDGNAPACTFDPASIIDIVVRPDIVTTIEPILPACIGDTVEVIININQLGLLTINTSASSSDVLLGDGNSVFYEVNALTTEFCINSIQYSDDPICVNDSLICVDIEVNELPTVSILNIDPTYCIDVNSPLLNSPSLDLQLTGSGNWDAELDDGPSGWVLDDSLTTVLVSYPLSDQSVEYCITEIEDLGTGCINSSINECIIYDYNILPSASIGTFDDLPICPGDDVVLSISSSDSTIVYIEQESTGIIDSLVLLDGFETITMNPDDTETYFLSSVVDFGGVCEVNYLDSVIISVHESPDSVLVIDTICNPNGEDYQLILQILGGDSTLLTTENLSTTGIFDGTVFTSTDITSGLGADFEFSDGDPCSIIFSSGVVVCPTISNAGLIEMDSVFCSDGQLCIDSLGGIVLDPNDVLNYVILSSDDPSTATLVSLNTSSCWDVALDLAFPPLLYNNTYFGYAVVGNDDGFGSIDINGTNFYSNPIPFVVYEEPVVSLTGDATICFGDSTAISITFNGSQPITTDIFLDGVFHETLNDISSPFEYYVFDEGIYTATNISTAHCPGSSIEQVEIIINPLPSATITTDGAICSNSDYDFEINCVGATPWQVDIELPNDVIETVNVAALPYVYNNFLGGVYTIVSVTDANNCTSLDTNSNATLTILDLPVPNVSTLDTSFCSGTVLDFPVYLTGSSPWQIDYLVNGNPDSVNSIGADTIIYIPISEAGTVTITTLTDDNNCINPDLNIIIDVTENETPIADAGADIVGLCSDISSLIGTAENIAFDYIWSGDISILTSLNDTTTSQPLVQTTNTTGIDQVYDLTLTVSNEQCVDTDQIQVTVASAPNTDAGNDINLCLGDQVTLSGIGGICDWNQIGDPANPTFVDETILCNPIVDPLVTTSYSLFTTGPNGCTALDSMTVFVSEEFVVDIDFTANVCFGTCEGEITITPAGGFGNYDVNWVDPIALDSLVETSLCEGVYSFTVFDNNNVCSIDTMITINELPFYQFDSLTVINPTCFEGLNSSNGSIEIVSSTGFQYFINSTLDDNNDGLFDGLPTGNYLVEVVDSTGCIASQNIPLVSDSPQLNVATDFSDYIACFQEEVVMTANANGGDDPYSYTWYNCFPTDITCLFDSDGDNQATFSVLDSSAIYVIAIDELGCNSDTAMINLTLTTPLEISSNVNQNTVICQGDSLLLEAIPGGGNENYTIGWFENVNPLGLDNNYIVSPMVNTTYTAVLTDGCSESISYIVNVIVNETPDVIISTDVNSGCFPVTINLNNQTNPALLGACTWNLGNGDTQPICADIEYTYTSPGVYNPSLTVVSPEGCLNIGYLSQPIVVSGYPVADFSWTPELITPLENEAQFINETVGGSLYSWSISGLLDSNDFEPMVEFPPDNVGNYEVCLIATSGVGCRDTICKILDIKNEIIIYVPNAFTPDLDGVNDFFKPVITGIDASDYLFRIYDQWGILLFQTTDVDGFWRGDNRKGEYYVETQTFNYVIQVKDIEDGNEYDFRGIVTIIR